MAEFICYFTGYDDVIREWDSRNPITPAQILEWYPNAEKKGTRIIDDMGFLYFNGSPTMPLRPKKTYYVPETTGTF
jgi:hypothetical protein